MAYSRAGYGFSDADALPRPLDWMTHEAVDVLPQVLAAFSLHDVILVGHSDGATIAAIHAGASGAGRLPLASPISAVVLIAPHFFTEKAGLAEIAHAREQFEDSDMPARMAKYHRDPNATFAGWADAWLDPGFREWNVEQFLDTIKVPVLAVQGRQDQYGTLAQIDTIKARVPGAVENLILENCYHAPHLEQPAALVAGISEICSKLHNAKLNH